MKGSPPFTRHPVKLEFLTPQLAGLGEELRNAKILWRGESIKVLSTPRTAWLIVKPGTPACAAVQLIHEAHGLDEVKVQEKTPGISISARGSLGKYRLRLMIEESEPLALRITRHLKPAAPVKLDGQFREICIVDRHLDPFKEGLLFTTQTGPTAGQAYVAAGGVAFFYFQNLGAQARYSSLTGASLISSVGIDWPMVGLKLPSGETPLPKNEEVLVSDFFLRITTGADEGEATRAAEFIDGLALAYRKVAPPPGPWFDWAAMSEKTLKSLVRSRECMRTVKGHAYLNAYVGSDDKPPESMVQGAVAVPLAEYECWLQKPHPLGRKLAGNLKPFFMTDLGTMARWLPGEKFLKDQPGDEEHQEKMDSWYLLHTLMNLGRLAELGGEAERKLFFDSLPYVIRVARHFDYDWPVFYHRRTLRVFRRETEDGAGGEQDSAGLYAHVMVQAWRLTKNLLYLQEAEAAASRLKGLGFGVLYQTNNTTFTAVALAWLWKETGNALYKDLSLVCMGSILSHLWMWEPARPGHSWRTFMGLPPLHDAPYIAAYEEAEVFAAFRAYLETLGEEAPPSLVELLTGFGKHLLGRARYYLPAELPPESVCREPKEGKIDPKLPIPVEDLYPGLDQAGQVGQEVYGSALALILTTRSYHRWKKVPFMVWCETPLSSVEFEIDPKTRGGTLKFCVLGSPLHRYSIRIIPSRHVKKRPRLTVHREEQGKRRAKVKPKQTAENHLGLDASGIATVTIGWKPG